MARDAWVFNPLFQSLDSPGVRPTNATGFDFDEHFSRPRLGEIFLHHFK